MRSLQSREGAACPMQLLLANSSEPASVPAFTAYLLRNCARSTLRPATCAG